MSTTAHGRLTGALIRRTPTWALLGGLAVMGLWNGLRWLAAHLVVAGALALALLTWWAVDRHWWPWLMGATGCICMGMGAAMELQPRWWRRLSTAWASARRLRWYRARWEMTMVGAGLTLGDDLPRLVAHRFGGQFGERDLDVLTVETVPGQTLTDWRHVQDRLAAAWGRTRVRTHGRTGAPMVLELFCSSRPLPNRSSVAGGQMPASIAEQVERVTQASLSTPVEQPVDEQDGAADMPPRGAFPKQPRGAQ